MKYFKLIRSGVDVAPLLEEVHSQEQAWRLNTSRQDKIAVQRDTNTIFISGSVARPDLNVNDNQDRSFPRIPQPSQPRVSSSCWLGGGISGGLNVPWARILRIPSASA